MTRLKRPTAARDDGEHPPVSGGRAGLARQLAAGALAAALTFAFWRSRMEWVEDMRLWRATGDASFMLLALALVIGPAAVLAKPARRLLPWRRALGVWFALTATLHAYLVWDGWALWSLRRLFGYQDLPLESGPTSVMTDPGFGLANLVGLVALFWALVLAAVSSDAVLARLGPSAWKHVQRFAYVVFHLAGLHGAYFLFLHYNLSLTSLVFQKGVPEPNWFRFWFVGVVAIVLVVEIAAFVRVVAARRAARRGSGAAAER